MLMKPFIPSLQQRQLRPLVSVRCSILDTVIDNKYCTFIIKYLYISTKPRLDNNTYAVINLRIKKKNEEANMPITKSKKTLTLAAMLIGSFISASGFAATSDEEFNSNLALQLTAAPAKSLFLPESGPTKVGQRNTNEQIMLVATKTPVTPGHRPIVDCPTRLTFGAAKVCKSTSDFLTNPTCLIDICMF